MDSLTQIVLGAAVGEAALGKKVGNRAMLWGAVGGTIPDLDVFANFFTDEITALAFHRSISHSLFFAFTVPLALGWLIHRFYASGFYRRRSWRIGITLFWILLLGLMING
ncbi:MAG: metal-dependent hydrolase, partial [Phaeodactylibacter sp.]|nr:metal-dependent hydrolase [Phaeodactylibacter sp.]